MKSSSYGIFDIEIQDAEGNTIATSQAFNDVTYAGLKHVMFHKFPEDVGSRYPSPFQYVKVGTDRTPTTKDMTDLVNPVIGYWSPIDRNGTVVADTSSRLGTPTKTEQIQLNGRNVPTLTRSFHFLRSTLMPGTYNEIGLFTHDPLTLKPLEMVSRALFNTPVTITEKQYLMIRYTLNINYGEPRASLVNVDGKDIHFVGTPGTSSRSNSMLDRFEGEGEIKCMASLRNTSEYFTHQGVVKVSTYDPETASRILLLEFSNHYSYPIEFYGYRLFTGESYSTLEGRSGVKVMPGKKAVFRVRQSMSYGMQRLDTEHTVTPLHYQPPSNLNASVNNPTPSYGASRVEFYVGEQLIAAGIGREHGVIDSWSSSISSMYSNNYVVKFKTFDEVGREYPGYSFVPSVQVGSQIYPLPDITYTLTSRLFGFNNVPSSVTHIRVFALRDQSITVDLAVGTLSQTLPESFAGITSIAARWVGSEGMSGITPLTVDVPLSFGGMVKNADGTKYRILPLSTSMSLDLKYRYLQGGQPTSASFYMYASNLYSDNWRTFPENFIEFFDVPVLGEDGKTVTLQTINKAQMAVAEVPKKITTFIPFETLAKPEEKIAPPYSLYVNEPRWNMRFTLGHTGQYRIYTHGVETPAYEGTGVMGEVVTLNYRSLFEVSSRGPVRICSVQDGVESLAIHYVSYALGSPDDIIDMSYDPINNVLKGKVGYNTAFVSIRRWLVSQLDISLLEGQTEFEIPLSISLDPSSRYEVFALSADGKHSTNALTIYPENSDDLEPPIYDISKPSSFNQYVYENYQNGLAGVRPNLAKYGAENFSGTFYDETIMTSTVEEVEPGRWKCEFSTRNWKYKFQLYDGYIHETASNELTVLGYPPTAPAPNGAYHFRCTMWSTWLRYSWDGFDAFLRSADIREPFRQSDNQFVGVTINQATGYYRMTVDSYRWNNNVGSGILIYDFTDTNKALPITSQLTDRIGHHFRDTREDRDFHIYINGVKATVQRTLDTDGKVVKFTISTPEYTYESPQASGEYWKLVSNTNRIDDPVYAEEIIKIEIGSMAFDEGNSYYLRHDNTGFSYDTTSSSYHYGAFTYAQKWNGWVASWCYYVRPYVSKKPIVYTVPTVDKLPAPALDFTTEGTLLTGVKYLINGIEATVEVLEYLTNSTVPSRWTVTRDGMIVEIELSSSIHKCLASPNGPFVLAIVGTDESSYLYYWGNVGTQFSGSSPYREGYNGYAFSMSVTGTSSAPITYRELTPSEVDMDVTNAFVTIPAPAFEHGVNVYIDGQWVEGNHLNDDIIQYVIPGDVLDTDFAFIGDFQYAERAIYIDEGEETGGEIGWTVEVTSDGRTWSGRFGNFSEHEDDEDYSVWIEDQINPISRGLVAYEWIDTQTPVINNTGEDLVIRMMAFRSSTGSEVFETATLIAENSQAIYPNAGASLYEWVFGPGEAIIPFHSYYNYINGTSPWFVMWIGDVADPTTLTRYTLPWDAWYGTTTDYTLEIPGGIRLINNTNRPVTLTFIPDRPYTNLMSPLTENSSYVYDELTGKHTVTLQADNGVKFKYDTTTTRFMYVTGPNKKYVLTMQDMSVVEYGTAKDYLQNAIKGNGIVGNALTSNYRSSYLSIASFVIDSAIYFMEPKDAGVTPHTFPELNDGRFVYVRPTTDISLSEEAIKHLLDDIPQEAIPEDINLLIALAAEELLSVTINGELAVITAVGHISPDDENPGIWLTYTVGDIEITHGLSIGMDSQSMITEPLSINKEFIEYDEPVVVVIAAQTTRLDEQVNLFTRVNGTVFTRSRDNMYYSRKTESIFTRETLLINFGYDNGKPAVVVDNSFQINVAPDSFGAEIIFLDSGVQSDRSVGSQMPDLWSGRFTAEDFAVRVNGLPAQLVYGGAIVDDGGYVTIDSPAFNGRLAALYGNQGDNGPMMMSMSDGETEAQFDYTTDNGLFIISGEQVFAYSPFSLYGWYLVNGVGGYYQIEIRGPSIGYHSDKPAFMTRPYPDYYNGDTIEYEMGDAFWYGRPNESGVGGYVVTGDVIVAPPMGDGPPPEIPEDAEGATVQEYTYTAVLTPPCVDSITVAGEQPDLSKFLLPLAPVIGVDTTVVQMGLTRPFNELSWVIDGEAAWFDEDYNFPGDGDTQGQIGFGRDIDSPAPQMWYALDDLDGDGMPRKPPGGANNDYSGNIYRLTNGITSLFYDTRTCTWYQDGEADGMHTVTYSMIAPPGADVSDVSIATMWGTQNEYIIPNNAFVSLGKESDWSYMCYGGFHIGHSVSEVTSETIPNTLLDYTYDSTNVPLFTWTDTVVNYVPNWRQHGLDAYEFSIGGRAITPTIIMGEREEGAESGIPDNNVTKILIQDDVTGYGVYFLDDPGNSGICAYVKDGRFDVEELSNFNQLVHRNMDLDPDYAQYVGTLGGVMPLPPPPPMASLMSFSLDGEEGEFIPNELPENVASQTFIGPRLRDKEAMGQRTSFVPTHDVSILVKCKEAFPVNAIPTAFVGDMNTYVAQSNGEVAFHADVGAVGKYLSALYILSCNGEGIAYNAHRMFGESDVSEFDRYNAYGDELRLSRPRSGGGGNSNTFNLS